jgi:hypothetical protein
MDVLSDANRKALDQSPASGPRAPASRFVRESREIFQSAEIRQGTVPPLYIDKVNSLPYDPTGEPDLK